MIRPAGIGDDHALENRVEDRFKKPLLARNLDKIALNISGCTSRMRSMSFPRNPRFIKSHEKISGALRDENPHLSRRLTRRACSSAAKRMNPRAPGLPLPDRRKPPNGRVDGDGASSADSNRGFPLPDGLPADRKVSF